MKHIIILAISLFTILGTATKASAQSAPDSLKKATIVVHNLTCNGDMPTIKKQLLNQDGIDDVVFTNRANGQSTFTISFHTSVIDRKTIESVIEKTPGCDDKSVTPYKVKKEKGGKL
ncbi:heavy-metal-associated domain-containing protein [Chitinophaga rhizosphaerae]|uniref:heavy-metal-associated domain-containing protein n=1 Tax=Chitinophaga rhizosphaerae TaxID=1864947 RepID=UPI000F7FD454|nr:heavy metal-associated domain-containing protein [Chitinophaga rhizosphaerae]